MAAIEIPCMISPARNKSCVLCVGGGHGRCLLHNRLVCFPLTRGAPAGRRWRRRGWPPVSFPNKDATDVVLCLYTAASTAVNAFGKKGGRFFTVVVWHHVRSQYFIREMRQSGTGLQTSSAVNARVLVPHHPAGTRQTKTKD